MKFTSDEYASYIQISKLKEGDIPVITKEIGEDVYADYSGKDGRLVGIEIILHIPKKLEKQ